MTSKAISRPPPAESQKAAFWPYKGDLTIESIRKIQKKRLVCWVEEDESALSGRLRKTRYPNHTSAARTLTEIYRIVHRNEHVSH